MDRYRLIREGADPENAPVIAREHLERLVELAQEAGLVDVAAHLRMALDS